MDEENKVENQEENKVESQEEPRVESQEEFKVDSPVEQEIKETVGSIEVPGVKDTFEQQTVSQEDYVRALANSTVQFLNLINAALVKLNYSRKQRKQAFRDFMDRGLIGGNINEELQKLIELTTKDTSEKAQSV